MLFRLTVLAAVRWAIAVAVVLAVLSPQTSVATAHAQGATGLPTAIDPRAERVPGRLIVKFKASASAAAVSAAATSQDVAAVRTLGREGARLMRTTPGRELEAIAALRRSGTVEYAEPDYIVRATLTPTDPLYVSQWGLPKINMPTAWNASTGSSSVVVAVLDTGLDLVHPDLVGQWAYATGFSSAQHVFLTPFPGFPACPNTGTPDDDGWQSPTNPFSHGTHVGGTIAARSTLTGGAEEGGAGIAPGIKLLPLKVLDCNGSGSTSDLATAIEFAAQRGARAINMSLGGDSGPIFTCPASLQSAIDVAWALGAVLVAAAGNNGTSATSVPAGCNHVISVGSTGTMDAASSFSQHNASVDLAAPGEGILSSYRSSSGSHTWISASGTSMATPHVSGCVALIRSVNPVASPDSVETVLRNTAVDVAAPPAAVGRDDYTGSGRIDCGAAVQAAVPAPTVAPVPTVVPSTAVPTVVPGTAAPRPTATALPATPTPVSGNTISASPNPIPSSLGSAATTINWSSTTHSFVELWLSVNFGPEVKFTSGSAAGSATTDPWLNAGYTYVFSLYDASKTTLLAQVTATKAVVVNSGSISASPNPAVGGSSTITWNTNGTSDTGQVWAGWNGGGEVLVWQDPQGSLAASWITPNPAQPNVYVFTLYAGQGHRSDSILGSVTVTS